MIGHCRPEVQGQMEEAVDFLPYGLVDFCMVIAKLLHVV